MPSPEIYIPAAKIYKGEKYRELPYVLLDYPRCFRKEDVLPYGTFFLVGELFSITLHLAGMYAEQHGVTVLENLQRQQNSSWFICVNKDQWQHHFEQDNFVEVHRVPYEEQVRQVKNTSFLKLLNMYP